MKTRVSIKLLSLALPVFLAACATPQKGKTKDAEDHEAHHPKSSSTAPATGQGMMGMMGSMDMKPMCDMHAHMMGEQAQQMNSGAPEMCRQHMEMKEAHCKPV